jgi:hypothetical protein
MATKSQDEQFSEHILVRDPLDEAIEWISHNLNPEDVFTETQLQYWAENNGYEKETP